MNPNDNPFPFDFSNIMRMLQEYLQNNRNFSPEELRKIIEEKIHELGIKGIQFPGDGSIDPSIFNNGPVGVFRVDIQQDENGLPKVDFNFNQVNDQSEFENFNSKIENQGHHNQQLVDYSSNDPHYEELEYPEFRLIVIDLTGMKEEDIEISVNNGALDVFALNQYYEYSKQIDLKGSIEFAHKFTNGVLEIKIY